MIKENQRLIRARDTEDELTCIVCPIGCRMQVQRKPEGKIEVTGNKCKRGSAYATEEFQDPRRIVTGTCAIVPSEEAGYAVLNSTRLPVRSSESVPVDDLAKFLAAMYELRLTPPVKRGDVIARDLGGTGIDLKATMTVETTGGGGDQ